MVRFTNSPKQAAIDGLKSTVRKLILHSPADIIHGHPTEFTKAVSLTNLKKCFLCYNMLHPVYIICFKYVNVFAACTNLDFKDVLIIFFSNRGLPIADTVNVQLAQISEPCLVKVR